MKESEYLMRLGRACCSKIEKGELRDNIKATRMLGDSKSIIILMTQQRLMSMRLVKYVKGIAEC